MGPVLVDLTAAPGADDEDIAFIDDVDSLSGTEVMLGCGNDNPY
jgi:hypothetical protein